jgi:hypothetical protein
MFAKRVKLIRDLHQEVSFLEKKIKREVSKFSDNIETEIRKKFKRLGQSVQIKIEKIEAWHFTESKNRKNPLIIYIESLNGRRINKNGDWVFLDDEFGHIETENIISVIDFENIINQLSEELDVNFKISYV